jgi:hypothetical protein
MNPYIKTNFGNTHVMIINAHCLKVQNAIRALGHKTHTGCGDSMHYSYMSMKKSNYKEILNMKYLCKGIKPLFKVVYLMKLDALSISNN